MIQMCKSEVSKDFDKTRLYHMVHGRGSVLFFFLNFREEWLIYNVVFISAIQSYTLYSFSL